MTIFLDLSPLDTPSRLRGIGQYIIGLASGFLELQAAGELALPIDGIALYDWRGRIAGPDGLAYTGTPTHPDEFKRTRYRMRKRLGLGRAARAVGAQLLHVTEPLALPLGSNIPMVLTAYDLIPLILHREYLGALPWARAIRHWQDSKCYRAARRIVAISHATRRDLIEYLGIDGDLVDVAHLGVDHARFAATPQRSDEREQLCARLGLAKPFLLYVGAFDARKNIELLIEAFANAGLAKDFDLVLAGALRERARLRLVGLAQRFGVENEVRVIGFVEDDDLAPLYRACHVHAFPSSYEGFGLTVAEALACGAPTVAVNASSIPEVAGDAALLVPPNDADALTETLRSLCHDQAKRFALSKAGPLFAARFRWRECARQTLECYRKALV